MRGRLFLALAIGALAACDEFEGDVDAAKGRAGVAVERVAAEGERPRHFRATWVGDPDATTSAALMALHQRASDLCHDADIVHLDGTTIDPGTVGLADLAVVFRCVPRTLPNHVKVGPGEAVPEQPPLPPGQRRAHTWTVAAPESRHDLFEAQLGGMVLDILVDACGGRGTSLHRVATYTERNEPPLSEKTHLFIDFSCAAPEDT